MKFRTKLLLLNGLPLLLFAAISLFLGLTQFRANLYNEKEGNLRSAALAALTFYSSQGYGDYRRQEDGFVWRGMNLNISRKTSIVDDLKKQTGTDFTFFFGKQAAMTSIRDKNGQRGIGLTADEAIQTHTLEEGKQLWCRHIVINGTPCQAYVIPIRQESDDAVVGALMASAPAEGLRAALRNYVLTTVAAMLLVLVAVFVFIHWHVNWFAQKFSEVTDRSRHDLLTGIYNKVTFESEASKALAAKKDDEVSALFLIDLDDFKQVNDTFGHQTGDEVLKALSGILSRTFRSSDIIGRIGGDEFMALMPISKDESLSQTDGMAQTILEKIRAAKIGKAQNLTCSIGVGIDDAHCGFPALYALADKALYAAKEKGKANFVRYSCPHVANEEK